MIDNEIIKAWDILCKLDFFNQRAGRELWNDKPEDIQNKDIEDFANDVQFLKDLINRQQAEIEELKIINEHLATFNIENEAEIERLYNTRVTEHSVQKQLSKAKADAIKDYKERLIFEIVNTPTKYQESGLLYSSGVANRQNEIIDIINGLDEKEMVGEE